MRKKKADIIKEAVEKLEVIEKSGDTEAGHMEADDILCNVLTALGCKEIADAFEKIDKWYA